MAGTKLHVLVVSIFLFHLVFLIDIILLLGIVHGHRVQSDDGLCAKSGGGSAKTLKQSKRQHGNQLTLLGSFVRTYFPSFFLTRSTIVRTMPHPLLRLRFI